MNILGYLKKNQLKFKDEPFNRVDALILSELGYFDFAPIQGKLPIKIGDLIDDPYYKKEDPYIDSFLVKSCRNLFRGMMVSPRFKDVTILEAKTVLDKKKTVQFGAVAVRFCRNIFIAFKGTDPNYVGWKEDFLLSFKKQMPSYSLGREFVEDVMAKYEGRVYLGGHSKGGNIAFHVLGNLEDDKRVTMAYSFDGPGAREDALFENNPKRKAKALKIVPRSSIVGILFANETDISIVDSRNAFILQHNPFEWKIAENDFVYLRKRSLSSRYLDKSLNGWIASLSEDEREHFTDIIFGALDDFETQDFTTFFKTFPKQWAPMTRSYWALSKEDRKFFNSVMRRLAKNLLTIKKP